MQRRDLERYLRAHGWTLARHGGKHDVWSRGGDFVTDRRRTGASFNTFELRLGERTVRFEYLLTKLEEAPYEAITAAVKALGG